MYYLNCYIFLTLFYPERLPRIMLVIRNRKMKNAFNRREEIIARNKNIIFIINFIDFFG